MTGQSPRKAYPGHADYDMAVGNLHRFVFDSVLKAGQPKLRRDGGPLYYLGGFAKAYVIECNGKTYALRVWLSDIGNAAHRYDAVSKYCRQARLPLFVEDFTYVHDGILVNGHRYPLLRMEWVNGETLADFIGGRLGDGAVLRTAAQEFLAMVRMLHGLGIAHGDLQSENMLVSRAPDGAVTFKLIDYDTLMVPALAGWPITSTGLPCYQHPRRGDSGLATVRDDYFSELVIYLSLLAVAENPNLWRQHPAPPVQRDKELLFVPEDFTAPHPTPVFHSLHRHGGLVRSLAVVLWNFTRCRSIGDLIPLEQVLEQAGAEEEESFDRKLERLMGGAGTSQRDLFDDMAFPRPVRAGAPRAATGPASGAGARDGRPVPMLVVPAPVVLAVDMRGAAVGERREADLGGGVKLELCGIPAGNFAMGGRGADEAPHEVTLTKPFWLGRTQVTQAQWEAVMGSNPSKFKGKDLPVETVSWNDASEFCKKLNTKGLLPAGWRWTLPTEAQWEYACRAGTTGNYAGSLTEMAWYDSNSGSKTHPVGTKQANAWGLSDMHGNVWEWCADWYANYPGGAATDPTGPNNGSDRVYRGGSWSRGGSICRSAYRDWNSPDARYYFTGFRVAAVSEERGLAGPAAVGSASGAGAGGRRPVPAAPVVDVNGANVGERREADLGGGVKLKLCGIPAGTFTMGGTGLGETSHEVTLTKSFWLGRTQVTQAQWEAVMGSNPSKFKGKDLPVEQVSWEDASEFCKKLNAKGLLPADWRWTLPTEAQWEYACRAGTPGDYAGTLADMAWYDRNSSGKTHPVGTKKPNAYGLRDMLGNVWEWCADWFGNYSAGVSTDPIGSSDGSDRVIRGGSWNADRSRCRSVYRSWDTPDHRLSFMGFRVATVPVEPVTTGPASGAGVGGGRPVPVVPVGDEYEPKAGERRVADLGGGVKLELYGIPVGTFTMGGTGSDETPHEVTLNKPFWLGRTQVTQAQWEAVMGSNPSRFKGKDLPVEQVIWEEVSEFCKKLNAKGLLPVGWRWTLPTEAQWEYACRAGTTEDYADTLAEMAWYESNSGSKTHPVGTKQANAWGLCDMHGNVWEWCADWYGDYPKGAVTDPTGSSSGTARVIRGGAWGFFGSSCRSANRDRITPDYRAGFVGFRVAAIPVEREQAGAAPTEPTSGAGAGDKQAVPLAGASAADLAVAKVGDLREADLGRGVKLELCGIPAGSFTMGGTGSNETPHLVTLTNAVWLGRTQVTQAQWQALMGSNPSYFKGKDLPVETVNWNDAAVFCHKLNAQGLLPAGWHWTLPPEAQWEYACRAGSTEDYAGTLAEMAWYDSNSGSMTHPVGMKKANDWGLNDMHGNVWEWCADWYGDYPKDPVTDPTEPTIGSLRVIRGGSWGSDGSTCRSAYRNRVTPVIGRNGVGFRVAAVPGEREQAGAAAVVPAPARPGTRSQTAPVPQPPATTGSTFWLDLKIWAALAAAVVALIGGGIWLRSGKGKQPNASERAANAAAAAALGGGSVGTRQVFALGGGQQFAVGYVPAGTFTMGSESDETPHSVTLSSPFWMGETEVTQGQWQALMGNNPSNFKSDPNLPVEQVSWDDAQGYVTALNARVALSNGWRWTLPTEAQWEYACRGGTTGEYAGDLDGMAWYSNNSDSKTHPVGTKKANAFGLSDMHGNVWEWCADWYGDYPKGAVTDPTGPNNGSRRVDRGGSWGYDGSRCRSASRSRYVSVDRGSDDGFRVAAVPGGG